MSDTVSGDISDESPSRTCEPIDASTANFSQVAVTGMVENKKSLVWMEEGEVQRISDTVGSLSDTMGSLKEEVKDVKAGTEEKFRDVCADIKKLKDDIKVVLHRKENQQVGN